MNKTRKKKLKVSMIAALTILVCLVLNTSRSDVDTASTSRKKSELIKFSENDKNEKDEKVTQTVPAGTRRDDEKY